MKTKGLIFFVISISILLLSCSKETTGPNQNPTEIWDIVIDNGIGNGTWELELLSDSTIVISGSWIFDYGNNAEVSCDFVSSTFTFNNTDFMFNADGTAHHSGINQDSDFILTVSGSINNGEGNGEYEIDFTQVEWESLNGVWSGTLNNGEGVTPIIQCYDFKMHFTKNYIRNNGWAILQLDDEVLFNEVNGDEIISFDNIISSRGTVIYIQNYYNNYGNHYIDIVADIDVPLGEWYLKGYNYSCEPLGEYEVTMNFPYGSYTKCMTAPSWYSWTHGGSTSSTITLDHQQYYLEEDGTISFFNAVYNEDTGIAYCDWEFDLSFNQGEVNYYDFDLGHEMLSKMIFSNKDLDWSSIVAYRNNYMSRNSFHHNFSSDDIGTEFMAFYTMDFPYEKLNFSVSGYNDSNTEYYSYSMMGDDIPSNVSIPDYTLSANFDYTNNKFEDISVDEQADQIAAYWTYDDRTLYVSLTVYTDTDQEVIEIPDIPEVILNDLGIYLDQLTLNNIGITDYDTADDFDDIINMVFQQQSPFISLYNEGYTYRKYDNLEVMQKQKEIDKNNTSGIIK